MHNLSSRKWFKNVSNSSKIFALEFARTLEWISHLELWCAKFSHLVCTVRKVAWGVRNGTCVPGEYFAWCEIFRTLNSGVRNWCLENSHLGLRISHLVMNFAPWIVVCEIFTPWFTRCENWLGVCEMALVCQEGVSHGAKIFAPWIEVCEIPAQLGAVFLQWP